MTDSIPLKDWQDRAAKVLPAGGFGVGVASGAQQVSTLAIAPP